MGTCPIMSFFYPVVLLAIPWSPFSYLSTRVRLSVAASLVVAPSRGIVVVGAASFAGALHLHLAKVAPRLGRSASSQHREGNSTDGMEGMTRPSASGICCTKTPMARSSGDTIHDRRVEASRAGRACPTSPILPGAGRWLWHDPSEQGRTGLDQP
ncbi:hypothetical protein QBC39DRAFT_346301 [Podospora conica]|nr:hypothetical protein QBC39DRAFT_346301 [Schizothecium conicum]